MATWNSCLPGVIDADSLGFNARTPFYSNMSLLLPGICPSTNERDSEDDDSDMDNGQTVATNSPDVELARM